MYIISTPQMSAETLDVVIIGGGPAGYSAARYAAIYMLKHVLYEGVTPGGQLLKTTYVENYPGTGKVLGYDLVMGPSKTARDTYRTEDGAVKLPLHPQEGDEVKSLNVVTGYRADAEDGGTTIIQADVKDISPLPSTSEGGSLFRVTTSNGDVVTTRAVIVATGALPLTLPFPPPPLLSTTGERSEYWNLMTCAVCDGRQRYFRKKPMAVIGGGDAAMEDALFLASTSEPVYVIHRSSKFKATPAMLAKARANPNIQFITDTIVVNVEGKEEKRGTEVVNTVTALVLKTGESTRTVPIAGAFFAIGHRPNSQLLVGKVDMHEDGYVKVIPGTDTATSLPGLHVAGDVSDKKYRQAACAVSSGIQAVYNVSRWLQNQPDTLPLPSA